MSALPDSQDNITPNTPSARTSFAKSADEPTELEKIGKARLTEQFGAEAANDPARSILRDRAENFRKEFGVETTEELSARIVQSRAENFQKEFGGVETTEELSARIIQSRAKNFREEFGVETTEELYAQIRDRNAAGWQATQQGLCDGMMAGVPKEEVLKNAGLHADTHLSCPIPKGP